MKLSLPVIFTLGLFIATVAVVWWIKPSDQATEPENWTAFVYHHGFGSARYLKQEGFSSYPQCRDFAQQKSTEYAGAPWECGGRCRFDASKQGYICEEMRNH